MELGRGKLDMYRGVLSVVVWHNMVLVNCSGRADAGTCLLGLSQGSSP